MAVDFIVRQLKSVVDIDTDGADRNLEKLDRATTELKTGLLQVGAAAAGFLSTLGGAAVGLERLSNEAFKYSDRALRMSRTIGISTKRFQELDFAASVVGARTRDLVDMLLQISDQARQAAQGSDDAKKAFNDLGVSVTGLDKKDPVELFRQLAEGIKELPPNINRAALASQLLGEEAARQFTSMATKGTAELDKLMATADQLGLTMTEGVLKRTRDAGREMQKFRALLESLRIDAIAQLLPTIEDVIQRLIEWTSENEELIEEGIRDLGKAVVDIGEDLIEFGDDVDEVVQKMGGWRDVLETIGQILLVGAIGKGISTVTTGLKALNAAVGALTGGTTITGALAGGGALGTLASVFAVLAAMAGSFYLVLKELEAFAKGGDSVFEDIAEWTGMSADETERMRDAAKKATEAWKGVKAAFDDIDFGPLERVFGSGDDESDSGIFSGYILWWVETFAARMQQVEAVLNMIVDGLNEFIEGIAEAAEAADKFFTDDRITGGDILGFGGAEQAQKAGDKMRADQATNGGGFMSAIGLGGDNITLNLTGSDESMMQQIEDFFEERDREKKRQAAAAFRGGNA